MGSYDVNLHDFYVDVARVADTAAQKIGVDEVARVLFAMRVIAQQRPFVERWRIARRLFFSSVTKHEESVATPEKVEG